MTVTEAEKKQLQIKGYAVIGEDKRIKYWTPDGREILFEPLMVTFVRNGLEGVRDANLDRGWLLNRPKKLKPYCPHCDKWHNTKSEIIKCGVKKTAFYTKCERAGRREIRKEDKIEIPMTKKEAESLKSQLGELRELVLKLGQEKVKWENSLTK